jgi:hypothetical protein
MRVCADETAWSTPKLATKPHGLSSLISFLLRQPNCAQSLHTSPWDNEDNASHIPRLKRSGPF